MRLGTAIEHLVEAYKYASDKEWIQDKVAWALYHTWKEADRKTENSSEIPNNCDTCKHWEHGAHSHYYCAKLAMRQECKYEPTDEPQTFDKPTKCLGCLYSDLDKAFHPCASCVDFGKYVGEVSGKDEPQTERSE